jgi:class 3 adenylate cyclase
VKILSTEQFEDESGLRGAMVASQPGSMSEEEIQQMIVLASRLREQAGGELDDDALMAVSEATGAPLDYIRLAVRSVPETQRKRSFFEQLRQSFLAFDPDTRRLVAGAVLGMGAGFMAFWSRALPGGDSSGFFSLFSTLFILAGLYNATVSRNVKTAIGSGALLGLVSQITLALFALLDGMVTLVGAEGSSPPAMIGLTLAGALGGGLGFELLSKNRKRLGLGDPAAERHQLLTQLLEIQSKLKEDEKFVTFISVDAVGSTRMKTENDQIAVEYTLNEYHQFIEQITLKNGGKIHSTAGDGVTCVFEDPKDAVTAGKAMQAGLFEFNAYRNKLKSPLVLRAAVHTGPVLAPGRESTAVNFAHVIDVAAHLQKVAEPGTLAVSSATAIYVGGLNAIGSERVTAEDVTAAVWRPRSSMKNVAPGSIVPPVPMKRN